MRLEGRGGAVATPVPAVREIADHAPGMRSYFVSRASKSSLSDAEIAMLIGDKTGPAIIAQTYGDLRRTTC